MLTQEQSYHVLQLRERIAMAIRATKNAKAVDEMRAVLVKLVEECATAQAKIRRRAVEEGKRTVSEREVIAEAIRKADAKKEADDRERAESAARAHEAAEAAAKAPAGGEAAAAKAPAGGEAAA